MIQSSYKANRCAMAGTSYVYMSAQYHIHVRISYVICVINVQGYKQRKGFIIAQSPMVTTVKDFVKMLYERECGVVVMLCGCEEGGMEMCAQYWPATAGTMMKYGEFMVSTVSINDTKDGFIQRAITITKVRQTRLKNCNKGLRARPERSD